MHSGHRFTTKAWQLTDQLWELQILDALDSEAVNVEEEIAKQVELTDGAREAEELRRLLAGLQDQGFVRLNDTSGGYLVQITPAGLTYRKHRPTIEVD